jgi:hypothetical protein
LAFGTASAASAQTITLRIVTYNIEADINGVTAARPGLVTPSAGGTVQQGGVLEGTGEEILGSDPARPIDILALEETTSNTGTVAPIATALNSFYNVPGMYTNSTYQATESGGDTADGNGPNACIYNTTTVQLVASVPVDPPGGTSQLGSSSGMYREVMRYEFAPAGVTPTPANEFYVYVSHYKSGTGTTNQKDRTGEATIIRNDAATNCPANARILYVGDYNISTSTETSYQIMLAATAPNGAVPGQGIDVMNPSGVSGIDWTVNSLLNQKSESSTSLHYRDDFEVMTTNVYSGTPGGLGLVPGTYHVFGNNGTTAYETSVNSGSNTSLTNLQAGAPISASQLYADLTTASDHLPVVADYTLSVGGPSMAVSPTGSFTSAGNQGGPFSPPTQTYALTNSGSAALGWTATNTANWLMLSATNGTLAAGATTNVTVSINANANGLAVNTYSDTVSFTNTSNGAGNTTRAVSLTVNPTPAQLAVGPTSGFSSSGYVGGPFTPPSATYSLTNVGGTALNWTASIGVNWLSLSATSGTLAAGSITNVTVAVNANANGVAVNTYSDTVSFANASNDASNTTRAVSLSVNPTPAQLAVGPASGFSPSGYVGGPFSPPSVTYSLTNVGGTTLSWTAHITSDWLSLSATGGTLPAGATTNVAVSVNTNANALTANTYSDTVSFTNMSNGAGNTNQPVSLTVNPTPALLAVGPAAGFSSSGFEGGPFSPPSQNYSLTNVGGTTLSWTANITSGWLSLSVTSGTIAAGATTNVVVSVNTNANGLTANTYSDTVSFTNISNGAGNTNEPVSLTILPISYMVAFQSWQVFYFGSTTNPAAAPTADPDNDGMSNWTEFLVGTDPTDPTSVFRIASITQQNNDLLITWTMGPGKTNVLQEAGSLGGAGSFTDVVALLTTGSVTNYLDLGAATNATQRYYRVRLGP